MLDPSTLAPLQQIPDGLGGRLRQLYLNSNIYRRKLNDSPQLIINTRVPGFWPGNADRGNRFFQGRYRFSGREARAPNQPPWRLRPDDEGWMSGLHSFDWLGDFAAIGVDAARQHAIKLIRSWIDLCFDLDPLIWSPTLTARRLMNWLVWWDFLAGDSLDQRFRAAFELSLGRHLAHLHASEKTLPDGWASLSIRMAETAAALASDQLRGSLDTTLGHLDELLTAQIQRDGVHLSGSPSIQFRIIGELLFLAKLARGIDRHALSDKLQVRAEAMAAVIEQLRDSQGDLVGFNGAYDIDSDEIDHLFTQLSAVPRTPLTTPAAGFQRLVSEEALVLFQGNMPDPRTSGMPPYFGAGSFHFSHQGQAIIVNCGSGMGRPGDWPTAARQGLAHSVLCIDGQACGEAAPGKGRPNINCRRHETDENNIWLELSHNGFSNQFNFLHQRRLFLRGGGLDLRGEDQLIPAAKNKALATAGFRVAFHLHPDVTATQVQDGNVLLKLKNGDGWHFLADGGTIGLEESVYLADPHSARRCQQITISGRVDHDVKLRWALRKS